LQGQYEDADIGLAYNRHRYYDPDAGRFISPDPIGLGGSTLDLFAYGQNPVTDVDPTGLHTATATLDGAPVINSQSGKQTFNSGGWGQNPYNQDQYLHKQKDGGAEFGTLYRESHSEFKIMRQLAPPNGGKSKALKGTTLRIDGQSRSCTNCAAELERFAKRNKMKIVYHSPNQKPDLECDFRPKSAGGTGESNRESYSSQTAALQSKK
jgi:RHS repeat-associated protein